MILYFSGTGNSKHVAETLAELLGERLLSMESTCPMPAMTEDEPLGIVFPVYAWGLPKIVEDYLADKRLSSRFVWTAMTCGDDMGYADMVLAKLLKRPINAAYSLQMPNTYVCLPGFDVDTPELAQKKMRETEDRLPRIAERIRKQESHTELTRGALPWLKTYVLRPLFNRFLVTDKYFKPTAACTSCGLCAKQCPAKDITIVAGRPAWQHVCCTGCLRCYHSCPQRAIEWGSFTKGKGQKSTLNIHTKL